MSYPDSHPRRTCHYPIFEWSVWVGFWILSCQDSRNAPKIKKKQNPSTFLKLLLKIQSCGLLVLLVLVEVLRI